jgi:tocopherol cyclase
MRTLYKIFHPEIFQGSLKEKNYFEGWYFKHVSFRTEEALAVIPGISLSDDSHSFIQFVDNSEKISAYFRYDLYEFRFNKEKFVINIGDSEFSSAGIELNIKSNDLIIKGKLDYSDNILLPSSLLSPGIMGWYSYIPGMECNHGVVSLNHKLSGTLSVNAKEKVFTGGKGYIEKDWGISFPEAWLWLQCNNFGEKDTSIMISIAKIPWKRSFFIGFIAFIHRNGKTELFASYNGARISLLRDSGSTKREILLEKGSQLLFASVTKGASSVLKAPSKGLMVNSIKESIDSFVEIEYSDGRGTTYLDSGTRAGYEETEHIISMVARP